MNKISLQPMINARRSERPRDVETSLASRAAWLHYAGGLTQAQVAERLGLSSVKTHRLISRAVQEGAVRFVIDGEVTECMALEDKLLNRYGLDYCEVVPDFDNDDLPLRALGVAGGQFLKRELERGTHDVIGVGHGRTLAACVDMMPPTSPTKSTVVSLLGGFTRKFAANPHDVIHRLAERTGAQAYVMPLPFVANSAQDRIVLLGQQGIREVFDLAEASALKIAGIGSTETHSSLFATGMIESDELEDIKKFGATGELLGHYYNDAGEPIETALSERTMATSREAMRQSKVFAIAGGRLKTRAIRAVLNSRILSGLITDECTALALVEESI